MAKNRGALLEGNKRPNRGLELKPCSTFVRQAVVEAAIEEFQLLPRTLVSHELSLDPNADPFFSSEFYGSKLFDQSNCCLSYLDRKILDVVALLNIIFPIIPSILFIFTSRGTLHF